MVLTFLSPPWPPPRKIQPRDDDTISPRWQRLVQRCQRSTGRRPTPCFYRSGMLEDHANIDLIDNVELGVLLASLRWPTPPRLPPSRLRPPPPPATEAQSAPRQRGGVTCPHCGERLRMSDRCDHYEIIAPRISDTERGAYRSFIEMDAKTGKPKECSGLDHFSRNEQQKKAKMENQGRTLVRDENGAFQWMLPQYGAMPAAAAPAAQDGAMPAERHHEGGLTMPHPKKRDRSPEGKSDRSPEGGASKEAKLAPQTIARSSEGLHFYGSSVSHWLETLKPGWARFQGAFAEVGIEDTGDFLHCNEEEIELLKDELTKAGARGLQLRKIIDGVWQAVQATRQATQAWG